MQSLGATNDKQKKHPPAPFKGGTLFVIFACLKTCFHWGLPMTNRPSVILPLPPPVICSASETDTLIDFHRNVLNEVKNLYSWLTFCYDEILHFVQNDRGEFDKKYGRLFLK